MSRVLISVVVPVYGSANNLEILVCRLRQSLSAIVGDDQYEIVMIDDNSPDDAWGVLQQIYQVNPANLYLFRLMRNFGQHNALMCGFHQVRGQYVVTIDDDLQNPPEEIALLYRMITDSGLDVVYGDISQDKKHHPVRNLGSWLVVRFSQIVFRHKTPLSSFRIIRHEVVEAMLRYDHNFTYIDGLISWCTQRIGSVPVSHESRHAGRSGYTLRKLIILAMNMFTNFSLLPLQVVSVMGITFACIGFILGIYYVLMRIFGYILVSGYASLIVSVLFLGGVQLLAIGVIGEYLGRIHINMNRKPQFIIREQSGSNPNS